jgi:hypothetical protein
MSLYKKKVNQKLVVHLVLFSCSLAFVSTLLKKSVTPSSTSRISTGVVSATARRSAKIPCKSINTVFPDVVYRKAFGPESYQDISGGQRD